MTNDQRSAIASRLRLARDRAGLSQGQVAKMLGLHRPAVTEIEAGRRSVSAEELAEMARLYSVSVNWLTNETQDLAEDKLHLAARELAKLKTEDVDRLMDLLKSLKSEPEDK